MKVFLLKILRWLLKIIARLTIWRYRPGIIGITGNVGKTSAKLAIAAVLGNERHIRVSKGNLNSELGVALTILGDWRDEEIFLVSLDCPAGERRFRKFLFWLKVLILGFGRLFFMRGREYPEILILEYGVQKPGDMSYLLDIARPNIGVITAVGDIPVHVEFFSGPEEVAREKARLIEYLPTAGFAILNHDDDTVYELRGRTRAHLLTFGFGKESAVRITHYEVRKDKDRPIGISFKIEYAGNTVPVRIDSVFGRAHAYAAAVGVSIGIAFGINLLKIVESLASYRPARGRGNLIPGVKGTYIIDESYNASPLSMHAALDTLRDLPAKRKIAILGDMLELGQYSLEAHEYLGEIAGEVVDVLVTVGPRAKFIAEGMKTKGAKSKIIVSFETADEAKIPVQDLIRKGDLILIKGSHALGLEKIVEEIRAF